MKEKVILIGAGGHARSVIDILIDNDDYDVVGCIDSAYPKKTFLEGMESVPIIGNDDSLEEFYTKGISNVFIALGNNRIRKKIYDNVIGIGYKPINVISKHSYISKSVSLGVGICVMHGAVVNVNGRIGNGCIMNTNSSVDHDCIINDFVHVAPGVAISGGTKIGEGTHIGTNSAIIDGITIGNWCYVGAGSVVVKNINDCCMAYGVPAREIRKMK